MHQINSLFDFDFTRCDTTEILKAVNKAGKPLYTLNGLLISLPNPNILLNTLSLQESKKSNEVEGIITTNELLLQAIETREGLDFATKEVLQYSDALQEGFIEMKECNNLITSKVLVKIQQKIRNTSEGFRTNGVTLRKGGTGEVIYTPPQSGDEVLRLMSDLEKFINDSDEIECDPLIKMALIHHQFERIHPFSDGNGRTGRILNSLYLVKEAGICVPVLYLSRYFVHNKHSYYTLIQEVTEQDKWEEWILYFLKGIETIATQTVSIVAEIQLLMVSYMEDIQKNCRCFSQELVELLFQHPYVMRETIQNKLSVSGPTATKYLNELCDHDFLVKVQKGNRNFYVNSELYQIFQKM
ncbi:Fic family protein (PDB:3CUC) [Commensalibacter communis]|uniref:Fic family protein n=1 Tax=Commensalibacter communis TaxID=2972786 RepID=UPI0022FFBD64|nr:Fic family protein [Commensalibacter communis]CAI3961248.1 Fic family protein (PDB:3CUC) [Commensalibacter communis]CAI3961981.1 Fic family protein (PDB:3CUC) [Commensalibacter communis]